MSVTLYAWFSACVLLLILVLLAWTLWKVRQIHLMAFRCAEQLERVLDRVQKEPQEHFRQSQALRQLEWLLGIDRPLPETRGWAASPDILLALVRQIFDRRPQEILECGSGVSTLVMALACKRVGSGRVISLDHLSEFAEQTERLLTDWGVRELVELKVAPITTRQVDGRTVQWYSVEALPDRLDLIFVDGPPEPLGPAIRWPAGPILLPLLASEGVAVIDDANRAQEQEMVRDWMQRFPNLRSQDLFCEKGGILLANVTR